MMLSTIIFTSFIITLFAAAYTFMHPIPCLCLPLLLAMTISGWRLSLFSSLETTNITICSSWWHVLLILDVFLILVSDFKSTHTSGYEVEQEIWCFWYTLLERGWWTPWPDQAPATVSSPSCFWPLWNSHTINPEWPPSISFQFHSGR